MKTITCFDDCLDYVNRSGVIPRGMSIQAFQVEICDLCDKLRDMSGQGTWYHKEFKPFTVWYLRKERAFRVYYHSIDVLRSPVSPSHHVAGHVHV